MTPGPQAATRAVMPGVLLALAGTLTFSIKAIIVKLAYRHGVDPYTLIMLRMLFALPFFLAMAWWAGRGKPPLARDEWLAVCGLGFIGYYLSSTLDFAGLQYITASLERLIIYITPTLVMLLGWLLHGHRPGAGQTAGMVVSYAGVALVFGLEARLEGRHVPLGALLVFVSCITYAIYLVASARWVRRMGSLRLVGWATSVACLCCIAQYLVLHPASSVLVVAPQVIGLSILNATLATVVPVLLVMMAIERVGAALTAQVGMVGPLSTIFMGVAWLDEPFTAWTAVGTGLVVAGVFLFTRAAARRPG